MRFSIDVSHAKPPGDRLQDHNVIEPSIYRSIDLLGLSDRCPGLPTKWVQELRDRTLRNGVICHAKSLRLPAGRHVERAKCEVDGREEAGEICIEPFFLRRVMPAVKDGTGHDIPQPPI